MTKPSEDKLTGALFGKVGDLTLTKFIQLMSSILGFLFVCLPVFAQENKYTLVALPQNLNLEPSPRVKDVWFDYDNAVLRQEHALDLIAETTGRCAPTTPKDQGTDHTVSLSKCKP